MDKIYATSYMKRESSFYEVEENRNIVQLLEDNKKNRPNDDAFVFAKPTGDSDRITWTQLWERSLSTAKGLLKLGVKSEDFVAICLRCCPEWLYSTFGAMMVRAKPVSVSITYTDGSDLIALMNKIESCSTLVMDPGRENVNWNIIEQLIDNYNSNGAVSSKQMPALRVLVGHAFEASVTNIKRFEDLLKEDVDDLKLPEIKPDDVAFICQTSGSTGVPKLVVHTHSSLTSLAQARLLLTDIRYKLFNDRPFSWIGGFPFSVFTGMCRVTICGMCEPPENLVQYLIDVIVKEQCTSVLAMPNLMSELLRRQDELPEHWPVEVIMTGGQPVSKNVVKAIGKSCQYICTLYGCTEFVGVTQGVVTDPECFTEHTSGVPFEIKGLEIKVVDNDGNIVPVNTRGEIYIRSPCLFKEYLNDPEKTAKVKTHDGWYKTDDMGQMSEVGEFIVGGRKSNIILSRGMTVAPEILEVVIKKCPGVDNAVVVPVPDDIAYQELCTCVIRKPGSDLQEAVLRAFCESIHADKPGLFTILPKYYIFYDKFPETSTGKVSRKDLEKMANDEIQAME